MQLYKKSLLSFKIEITRHHPEYEELRRINVYCPQCNSILCKCNYLNDPYPHFSCDKCETYYYYEHKYINKLNNCWLYLPYLKENIIYHTLIRLLKTQSFTVYDNFQKCFFSPYIKEKINKKFAYSRLHPGKQSYYDLSSELKIIL